MSGVTEKPQAKEPMKVAASDSEGEQLDPVV